MSPEQWGAFSASLIFTLAAAGTPGPNNMLLTASGAQFGLWRTLPFWLGIRLGNAAMLLAIGAGLGELLELYPSLHRALQILSALYLLYLAWRIAQVRLGSASQEQAKPIGVLAAAAFQFVNPKVWATTLASVSAFSLPGPAYWPSLSWLLLAWLLSGSVMNLMWIAFGVGIRHWLNSPRRQFWFAQGMGGLTAATVLLVFW
ncbi:LysE family transporter [Gallaecimonas kandeliae]|uniref:LysE family translocator n=1 Tax=Gallaecimonas kandeliae TaxID=3029055 RepID=UPI002647D72F|nr:LysE family transporter [Gallaecimonas kandeliae]WKE65102.1 LysE family transporter [Gallaecimonas kandeliae]